MITKTVVILTNIGSPAAPNVSATKAYLKKFLSDPRVIKIPKEIWWYILRLAILPFRSKKSAHAYQAIWTSTGSPLVNISRKQAEKLTLLLQRIYGENITAVFATHYGEPNIPQVLNNLKTQGFEQFILLPLYPQYSASTTASSFDLCADVFKQWQTIPGFLFVRDYHDNADYIAAVAQKIKRFWQTHGRSKHLLFSFHGLPEQFIKDGDIYEQHCRHTTSLLVTYLGLKSDEWSLAFQSRLGPAKWLQPYCNETLKRMPQKGIIDVDIVCPGFSADCLETLEEIAIQNKKIFMDAGGQQYRYIEALNDDDEHIELMGKLISRFL